MNNFILFIKGLIIGIGQIIPGVSGGMLAISLGLYDKCINIISNFFKDFKNNLKFIFPIFLGIITSIILISKVVKLSILMFYVPTMMLFIGLIIGTFRSTLEKIDIKSNKKYIIISIIIALILISLTFINTKKVSYEINIDIKNFLILIFVGFTYAFATVVPGVSATALMVMIGYYSLIIDLISNLTNIKSTLSNIDIIIPLLIGLVLGVIYTSKLMNYLFNKKKILTQFIILGLISSSVFTMFVNVITYSFNLLHTIIGFILMYFGYKISQKLDNIK